MNGVPPYSYQNRPVGSDERQAQPAQDRLPPISQMQTSSPRGSQRASDSGSTLPPIAAQQQGPGGPHYAYTPSQLGRTSSSSQLHQLSQQPAQHANAYGAPDNLKALAMNSAPGQASQQQSQASTQPSAYPPYMPQYSSAPQDSFQSTASQQQAQAGPTQYNFGGSLPTAYPQPGPPRSEALLPAFQPAGPTSNGVVTRTQDRPVPVVGSQGRRGILPSANGRPSALLHNSGDPRATLNSQTRRPHDGKFECPFCAKSYLHLKHLKRHHLRHTGERPYQCYLCEETFCRSDILKRHFHKCSIRRGNPTGATHLTHAQAHLAHNRRTAPSPMQASGALAIGAPAQAQQAPPSSYRPGWPGSSTNPGADPVADSGRSSRSSSVVHRPGSSADERRPIAGMAGQGPQTANTSLDTSPQSNGDVRKFDGSNGAQPFNSYSRELPGTSSFHETAPPNHLQQGSQPPTYQNGYYGGAAPGQHYQSASHPEPYGGYNSYAAPQTNGYRAGFPGPGESSTQAYPEPNAYGPYSSFFQSGSNDPVMFHSNHQQ